LKHRKRLYCAIEVLGEEVPEDLGPEKGFDCGGYLVLEIVSWATMETRETSAGEAYILML